MEKRFRSLESLDPKSDPYYVLIFVTACALLSILVVFFMALMRPH
jgi:hypothetical protein